MKVVIDSPVKHGLDVLDEGSTLELSDEQGQALLDAGAATLIVEEVKAKKLKAAATDAAAPDEQV